MKYVVVSDLTEESHGNATGIGLADFTTERLRGRIDYPVTYENVLTSTFVERAKVPIVLPHDHAAVEAAVRCTWGVPPESSRLVRIPNTLHLERLQVSVPLVPELLERGGAEVLGEPFALPFGPDGHLAPFGGHGAAVPRRGSWNEVDGVAEREGRRGRDSVAGAS